MSSFRHIATSPLAGPCRGLLVSMATWGKPATGADVGLTWGWNMRHPIKVPHGAER